MDETVRTSPFWAILVYGLLFDGGAPVDQALFMLKIDRGMPRRL